MLTAFSDNLVFFVTPSDLAAKAPPAAGPSGSAAWSRPARRSASAQDGKPAARFRVTDGTAGVPVTYVGILPDLFREGQGVVTLGAMQPDGTFRASEVLAKHDETYMPKEVAEALKKSGHWNPEQGPPPPAATWNTLMPSSGMPTSGVPKAASGS